MKKFYIAIIASAYCLALSAQKELIQPVNISSAIPGMPGAVLTVQKETRAVQSVNIQQGKFTQKNTSSQKSSVIQPKSSGGCDTMTYITAKDTVLNTWNFGSIGYMGGTFSYTNKSPKWAEYFVNTTPSTWIQNVEMTFTKAGYSNPSDDFQLTVWDNNGAGGAPGTIWATYNIPYKTIADWIKNYNGNAVRVTVSFNSPISVNGNPTFFVGIQCDTLTPDTLATAYTKNLFTQTGRNNNVWTNVAGTWNEVKNIFVEQSTNDPLWLNGFTQVGLTNFPISSYPTPLTDTICAQSTINFTAKDTANVVSFQWLCNGGSPGTVSGMSPAVKYPQPGIYFYQFKAFNKCGMYNSHLGQITVDTLPIVTMNASADSLCPGQTVNLSAGGAVSYSWNGGGITGNSGATQNDAVTNTTKYIVTGTAANGCTNRDSATVIVPGPVTANTAYAPTSNICMNTVITFSANGSTNADSYNWYIPGSNNPTSTQMGPTAQYSTPGTKTVSLVASNMCFSDSTSFTLTVDTCYPAGIVQINNSPEVRAYITGNGIFLDVNKLTGSSNLALINMSGETVWNRQINLVSGKRNYPFDCDLPTGVYVIRMISTDKVYTFKCYME